MFFEAVTNNILLSFSVEDGSNIPHLLIYLSELFPPNNQHISNISIISQSPLSGNQ